MTEDTGRERRHELIDAHNRRLSYLRISITDHCNLNCIYCRPFPGGAKVAHRDILRYEELLRIVRIVTELGISKVRITGGDPLVRSHVYEFLGRLTRIDGLRDVSLTTNGVLLEKNLEKLQSAGIRRLNISLDSLKPEKITAITGHDVFDRIWRGIHKAHEMGFAPIKINMVPIGGINDDEIEVFAKLSFTYPFHIRFIEYMPIGDTGIGSDRRIVAADIKERIAAAFGPLSPVAQSSDGGPAQRYRLEGAPGEIGLIQPISQHFCATCNRLRLTANGRLRLCLLSNLQEDLMTPIRNGCSDDELKDIILSAIRKKPMQHNFSGGSSDCLKDQMSAIGG
jgi:cyclic pyranopterin phosphate synthase